jgi:hypothetical protein
VKGLLEGRPILLKRRKKDRNLNKEQDQKEK